MPFAENINVDHQTEAPPQFYYEVNCVPFSANCTITKLSEVSLLLMETAIKTQTTGDPEKENDYEPLGMNAASVRFEEAVT